MTGLREKFLSSYLSRFEKHGNPFDNFYVFGHKMKNGLTAEVGVELRKFGGYELENPFYVGGFSPSWKLGGGKPKYGNLYLVTLECHYKFEEKDVSSLRKLVDRYNSYIGYNTINLIEDPPRRASGEATFPESLILSSLETPPYILLDFLEDFEGEVGKKKKSKKFQ